MTSHGREGMRFDDPKYEHLDPITFQVIAHRLKSASREMGITMERTAYSPIFTDGLDFSCAILDRRGEMAAQADFGPIHLGAMKYAVEWSLLEIGYENLEPGDVLLLNDPYRGGTHIPDVTAMMPIFFEGDLIAFAVNRAHQLDFGGKSQGSMAGDATEIFHEGLIIPPVKWYSRGEMNRDLFRTIVANIRIPELQIGDFEAQYASCKTGERHVLALCQRYGPQVVHETLDALKDYSERRIRESIRDMPDGAYTYEDYLDNDGVTDDVHRVRVTVHIQGTDVTFDYTGTGPQADGPTNAVYGITAAATYITFLQVTDPNVWINGGCFRPVTLIAPKGTLVNARYPAPTNGGNLEVSMRIADVCLGAFAQAVPERVFGAQYGTFNNFTGGGQDSRSGKPFVFYFYFEGGFGARATKDGLSAMADYGGNPKIMPMEIAELSYPILYRQCELIPDSGGPGRFRGGLGVRREIQMNGERMEVNAIGDRHEGAPFGLFGGGPGRTNGILVSLEGGEFQTFKQAFGTHSISKFANVPLARGATLRFDSGGGGGYGDLFARDPEAVLRDVLLGLVSAAGARNDYGVAIVERDGAYIVDPKETAALRQTRSRPFHLVRGSIGVNQFSYEQRQQPERPAGPLRTPLEEAIFQSRELLDREVCQHGCVKQADPKRCIFYNEEALIGWASNHLVTWTHEHCPQAPKLPL